MSDRNGMCPGERRETIIDFNAQIRPRTKEIAPGFGFEQNQPLAIFLKTIVSRDWKLEQAIGQDMSCPDVVYDEHAIWLG